GDPRNQSRGSHRPHYRREGGGVMAMPLESPISFTNVGRIRWWQRGIFASQTGYVLLALLVLIVVMHFASPYFFTEGNLQDVAKNFSFIAIETVALSLVI